MFLHDDCNKRIVYTDFSLYPSFISLLSVLYRSKNSNWTWKTQDQTICHMSTVWPDCSGIRVRAHSERVLGLCFFCLISFFTSHQQSFN